ncbi:hypothetical protein [Pseudovibrio sp. Tun.PSC04-5.I4]|uniref:hypothetical protein n=1 Tax=Pseudovibrio sp. Tun.PSC04-5.I4 TaxID=1798213 RepID=UPI0008920D2A|nr:hypothetical protein [Pseudovibrio sp. Tun.PSC04-5.I4]SDQ96074.1 hypothetical protein SAMN04515695_2070 [Pseudovibrio sp. Tun.PSC04-5.I4]
MIESDEAISDLAAAKAADAIGVFSGYVKDYTINDYSEEWIDHPNLKENFDQDALLAFLQLGTAINYGETTVAEMTVDANLMSEVTSHSVLSDYKSSGSKDGKTDLITVANYVTTSKTRMESENVSSNVTSDTVTTYNNVKITDIDVRPLLAFFQITDAPTAKYMGGYSAEDIKIEMSVDGAKAYDPIGKMVMSIASTSAQDLSISGGDGLKLLSIIEKLDVEDADPSEETIFELFDSLGTYSIGYSDVKDLAVKVWDPIRAKRETEVAPSFEMTLASASMSDFSSNSLGSVKFEGFHGAIEGDDAVFDIDSFEIADIAWPSLKTMVEKGMMVERDPNAALDIIPTIGKFSITGVEAITDDLDTPVSLSEFTLLMENHIGPIPTRITQVIGDLEFDAALLEDPMVLGVLERLGIERVTINEGFNIAWDEDTEDLILEKFEFELKNGLKLRADIQLGGIPRSLFTDPEQAEAVITLATFKGAQIEVMDSPLISELLAAQAEQAGVPAEMLSAMMIDGMLQEAGPLAKTDFAIELAKAVKSFAMNSTNLRVTLAPEAPVSVMQLGGMAALAPQELPKLLGATVSYSE